MQCHHLPALSSHSSHREWHELDECSIIYQSHCSSSGVIVIFTPHIHLPCLNLAPYITHNSTRLLAVGHRRVLLLAARSVSLQQRWGYRCLISSTAAGSFSCRALTAVTSKQHIWLLHDFKATKGFTQLPFKHKNRANKVMASCHLDIL